MRYEGMAEFGSLLQEVGPSGASQRNRLARGLQSGLGRGDLKEEKQVTHTNTQHEHQHTTHDTHTLTHTHTHTHTHRHRHTHTHELRTCNGATTAY